MRYQIGLIWISSIRLTGSQIKWKQTLFDFCRNIGLFTFSLELYNEDKVYVLPIQSVNIVPSTCLVLWLDLTLCIYFCSMDTVPWHWHYLLISPLSDDEMWLAGRRLRTVGAGPHLAWPHNFSTLILNSDHLRLSRQKVGSDSFIC